jgi:hypothetical protein
MRRDVWLTAEQAEQERRFIAWCARWALPVAGGLGFVVLALVLSALWRLSEMLFT